MSELGGKRSERGTASGGFCTLNFTPHQAEHAGPFATIRRATNPLFTIVVCLSRCRYIVPALLCASRPTTDIYGIYIVRTCRPRSPCFLSFEPLRALPQNFRRSPNPAFLPDQSQIANMAQTNGSVKSFPKIKEIKTFIIQGVGSGGDYHNVKGGHWLIDSKISTPMSGYDAYRSSRTTWGINVLGSFCVEIEATDGTKGFATGFGGPPACWLTAEHFRRFLIGAGKNVSLQKAYTH